MNSRSYNNSYYLARRVELIGRQKDKARSRRAMMREAKNKPCADCGVEYPYYVMQFDHVRGQKLFNIGVMLYKRGIKRLREEIEKCDVVCANCHAKRTFKRSYGDVV